MSDVAAKLGYQNSAVNKLLRKSNTLQFSLMGISIMASMLGMTAQDYQVFGKLKKMLGWKPKPLNKPQHTTTTITSTAQQSIPTTTQPIAPSTQPIRTIAKPIAPTTKPISKSLKPLNAKLSKSTKLIKSPKITSQHPTVIPHTTTKMNPN